MKTTIQINQETLEKLKKFKQHNRESYDEILNKILDEIEEESLNEKEIDEIKEALENVRKGLVKPIEQVAKEIGVLLK